MFFGQRVLSKCRHYSLHSQLWFLFLLLFFYILAIFALSTVITIRPPNALLYNRNLLAYPNASPKLLNQFFNPAIIPDPKKQLQHLDNIEVLLKVSGKLAAIIDIFENVYIYKNYCILKNVIKNKLQQQRDYVERITMILHCSSDQLDERLVEQVKAWDGPVSVAVVLPELNTTNAIEEAAYTLKNFERLFHGKVSAHLLYRTDKNCSLNNGDGVNAVSKQYIYPINVARNVARMMSSTKFIVVADYEYIFSKNFEGQMRRLLKRVTKENPKTALIFRIFECNDTLVSPPRDKETLYRYYRTGDVIVFHEKFVGGAHMITGLTEWFKRNSSKTEATIDRTIPYKRRNWEPQFVSLATIPYHDENFPYPIRDNTVLRWEMCRMNYTWILVNDHFMVHPGIKTGSKKIKKLKSIAQSQFWKAIKMFRKRMEDNYPETSKTCPSAGY